MSAFPERPVDPDWLALREPADAQSRDSAVEAIIEPLLRRLRNRVDPGLSVVDLGAGTGANLRWLAPRLAPPGGPADLNAQQCTLVDHDPRLRPWGPAPWTTVRADVADLARLLSELGRPDLVAAAALLDLLDGAQLGAVVDTVVAHRVPALFSLSVTGAVALDPPDPLDRQLAAAFDAHQRRGGRLGPDAGREAADLFRRRGWVVVEAQTPWRLGWQPAELIDAWLVGRVDAAVEWRPELAAVAAGWLERRRDQRRAGGLSAVVGHLDLLALPAPDPAS